MSRKTSLDCSAVIIGEIVKTASEAKSIIDS